MRMKICLVTLSLASAGAIYQRPVLMTSDGADGDVVEVETLQTFTQKLPPTSGWRYKGRTVTLIDERAVSQAEHSCLFFEAANGMKFVGSPTAGTNGDVTYLVRRAASRSASRGRQCGMRTAGSCSASESSPTCRRRPRSQGFAPGATRCSKKR
jgi:hypothetical protein